jgi:hypothetical protein
VSLETKIDIVVKNLNQLNKLADNLKGINRNTSEVVKGLNKVQGSLNKISSTNLSGVEKSLSNMRDSADNLNKVLGKDMGFSSAFKGIAKSASNAAESFSKGFSRSMFNSAAIGIGKVGLAGGALKATLAGVSGQWTLIAAAMMGFGPQIVSSILGISQGLIKVTGGLKNLGRSTQETLIGMTGGIRNMKIEIENTTQAFKNMLVGGSLNELNMHVANAKKEMQSFWHMTRGAEEGAKKLAAAMRAQSKEQRAINDLLLKAQGKATTGEQADNKRALDAFKAKTIKAQEHAEQLKADAAAAAERKKQISHLLLRRKIKNRERAADRKARQEQAGGRQKENLMLGAGFPLLFGGGVGSVGGGVGGALLGNKMGMPGFGAQILGSAIGTMMDTAVQKAAKLGEALRSMDMNELVDSGVRLSSELQVQVNLLRKAGDIEKARALVAQQVQSQTGASADSLQDVNNTVNLVKAAWNDVVGAVGAFLGIISSPVLVALSAILKLTAMAFAGWNKLFGLIRDGIMWVMNKLPSGVNDFIAGLVDGVNPALQESISKATELGNKMRDNAVMLRRELEIRSAMPLGGSFENQRARVKGESQIKLEKFDRETNKLREQGFAHDENFDEDAFKEERAAGKALIFKEQLDATTKINQQEDQLLTKLERQNELKAALFGIDQKIAQARSDEDKELEFRLGAQKEIANITSKLMEDTAGKDDAEKEEKLALAKLDIAKVTFALQTKIDEFRKKGKEEAEDVLADLQKQNDLLQGKIDGNEEEIKQQQTIEKIVDKIGLGYAHQVIKLVEKNGELTKEAENAKKLEKLWENIKETVASGLTDAIMGLIDGTKSLGESLAGIAKQIASMALKSAITSILPFAEGGYARNGIKAFSSGGMATRPTLGLVGEAGEDEYIIPASKMAQSMQRYSAGARGEAVIPGTGSSAGGSAGTSSTTVNYSGPILNFNSEEFVPKSAIGEIINSAASRGAKAGEARTLASLQNSRSRRSNIGL